MIREDMRTASQVTLCCNFSQISKICVHAMGIVTSAYMIHRYCLNLMFVSSCIIVQFKLFTNQMQQFSSLLS